MRVLIACEASGRVRDAFKARGHDVWSCDLLPTRRTGWHFQGDVLKVLDGKWDLLIAHPPCTYLTTAANWCMNNPRFPNRKAQQDEAVAFFLALAHCKIPRRCIENPVGVMSTRYRPADQYIQPYQFGEDASKKTGLWLYGLPPLTIPDKSLWHPGRQVGNKTRWSNQTDSGQNKLGSSNANRAALRSETYTAIAEAMAREWG